MKVKSQVKSGKSSINHTLRVRTGVKAGGKGSSINHTLRVR